VDRRITTGRLTTADDTRRVPVVDLAPTRLYRQPRRARTAPPRPALIIMDDPDPGAASWPDARVGPLAHPRLVRRTRPPTPAPNLPPRRPPSQRDREFDEEPTDRCR
jgi:hypothetical protein